MARSGINKVILVGNLGGDPEVRYTPNGSAVTNLSVATGESWMDKNTNQRQERTEWHRVVLFGKLAEVAGQYLRKGSKVYLEGKLQTRKWQDQQGQDRYSTEVVVDGFDGVMQMLDSRQDGGNANMSGGQSYNQAPRQQAPVQQSSQQSNQGYGQSAPAQQPAQNQGYGNYQNQNQQQTSQQNRAPQQQPQANQGYGQRQQQQAAPAQQPAPAAAPAGGFDDFDDDIPF